MVTESVVRSVFSTLLMTGAVVSVVDAVVAVWLTHVWLILPAVSTVRVLISYVVPGVSNVAL